MTSTTHGRAASPPTGDEVVVRARLHAALGDEHRLAIVDALRLTDRTVGELLSITGATSSLLAFHLDALEDVGLVERRRSQGDGRRRYVTLRWSTLRTVETSPAAPLPPIVAAARGHVVFVCTRSAARSQLAAALWRARTGGVATSAGLEPATEVDPLAVAVARAHDLETEGWAPATYDEVQPEPSLVVSVCDRAREAGVPWSAPQLHWSVPDPHGSVREEYERAFRDVDARVQRLVAAAA